jgi:hypothetical protein
MPNHGGTSQRARHEPQPAPFHTEEGTSRRDLTSWWKNFKRGAQKRDDDKGKLTHHGTHEMNA